MKAESFNRLHTLRMENDEAGYAMAELRPRFVTMQNRHENGTAPQAVAVHQLFQTPTAIAAQLVALLGLKAGERVLEPSAGSGRLLDAIPRECETVSIEISPICTAELYRANRINVRILQRDFLTVKPEEIGLFDAVAMNSPFTMRADIKHIEHALKFVRSGGRLAALCLNTWQRREALASRCCHWEELPEGEFAKEGTRVSTVLMMVKKP